MPALDVFKGSAFSVQEMTKAINIIPTQYGLINQLGLFKERGVSTTSVAVERKNGTLNILSATERGGPGTQNVSGKREMIQLAIPNFTHNDQILADSVQNVRKFDTESDLESVQDVVNDKLAEMKAKHEITLEYMRCGALQGLVKDGDGTVLCDLFASFGVTQKSFDFKTSAATTAIPTVLRNVKRYLEQNLKGEVMSNVLCLCSGNFFEALVNHDSLKDAYNAYQGRTPYRDDMRQDFVFNGIRFVEYEAFASNSKGQSLRLIPDNQAIFIPQGTINTFETVFAPADYIETVNTKGVAYYAKQQILDFERGIAVQTQSNPLTICKRPDLLVKATLS